MNSYLYPAVFTPEDTGFSVCFPDLESCYTQGDDLQDAFQMAQDVLCLTLYRMEEAGAPIPTPSSIDGVAVSGHSFASFVDADTLEYRKYYDKKAVKKTLTIPAWLNTAAERAGLNFSQVLKEGLIRQLGI